MLTVQDLAVQYNTTTVLHDIHLSIKHGEILCLLGASGCGKTTLLRTIAGLEHPFKGDVLLAGDSIVKRPVHQREFGLMFQDFALFPHLNVIQNVMFGLRMKRVREPERITRAREVLDLVGLADFAERDVSQLSGGEKQRVALARSLAPNPRLLMLDEPLGSLDAALRERLALDLKHIIKQVGLTAIYVTHDQQEAFAIADRIAVMNAGRIEQIAAPDVLYQAPETVFVAQFLGLNNIISGIQAAHISPEGDYVTDERYLLHPDALAVIAEGDSAHLRGHITERVFMGSYYRVRVRIDQHTEFIARVTGERIPDIGERVGLQLRASLIHLRRTAQDSSR